MTLEVSSSAWLRYQSCHHLSCKRFVTDLSTFAFHSGGPAVLARRAEDGGGVRCRFVPPLVPQRVQRYQRGLLRGPGPAVRHHLLQNIQGHFTSRSEVRGWTPLQVRTRTRFLFALRRLKG